MKATPFHLQIAYAMICLAGMLVENIHVSTSLLELLYTYTHICTIKLGNLPTY